MNNKLKSLIISLLLILPCIAFAHSQEQKNLLQEIYRNTRCLVCGNQTLSDSDSDFAINLREIIAEKVQAGASREEIEKFLIDKYDKSITYNTPIDQETIILWAMPLMIFILLVYFARDNLKNKI